MGLLNWSPRPELNGVADPLIPAMDGASARGFPALVRGVMAEVARHASDQGGALKTAGLANAFTVSTASGVSALRNGLRFIIRPDRTNTDAPTLNVDGTGPKPWLDASGDVIVAQGVVPDHIMAVTYDADLDAWRSDGVLAIRNEGLAAMPPLTLKGNGGPEASAPADLTPEEARVVIGLDHVANKSEAEMVASGAIADALAEKISGIGLAAAIDPIVADLNTKASKVYVDDAVETVATGLTNLQDDFADLDEHVSDLESGQSSGVIIAKTWTQLSAIAPTQNGRAEIPGAAITTHADPVASGNPTVPDPGTYRGSLSPLGWERVGPTTSSAAAAEVGESITVSSLARAPALQLAFRDPDTKRLTVLSPADSAAFIQEIAVPPLYATDLTNVVVTDQSTIILGADASRRGDLLIQLLDDADIGLNFSDRPAVFGQQGTWPQKAGQWVNHGFVGTKAVAAIARGPNNTAYTGPVKLNVRVQRTVDADLPSTIADNIFARWPDSADPRFKDVIRQEVDYLVRQGIYQKLTMWWMPGASRENNRVNLANPNAPLFTYQNGTNGIEVAPYKYMKSSGNDAYVSTGLTAAQLGMTTSDHFMTSKIYPGGGVQSDGYSMGSSINLFNQPNRAANLHGFRSGGATDTYAGGTDLSTSLSRFNSAAEFGVFVDGARIATKARALDILPDRIFNLLGVNASAGYGFVSTLPLQFAAAGPGLQDVSVNRFNDSCKRIAAVCAQITGA